MCVFFSCSALYCVSCCLPTALDDRQETSLIEIMVCCCKQAATGEFPVGRQPARKPTQRENRQVIEDKVKLTEHFIQALPQLLAKVSSRSTWSRSIRVHPAVSRWLCMYTYR